VVGAAVVVAGAAVVVAGAAVVAPKQLDAEAPHCDPEGQHQLSCPFNPQQTSVAEQQVLIPNWLAEQQTVLSAQQNAFELAPEPKFPQQLCVRLHCVEERYHTQHCLLGSVRQEGVIVPDPQHSPALQVGPA